jgi:hypothetical protein
MSNQGPAARPHARRGRVRAPRLRRLDLDACEIRIKETLARLDEGGLRPGTRRGKRSACEEEVGADDGNRTRMTSLEGWSSTIELHPPGSSRDERHQ